MPYEQDLKGDKNEKLFWLVFIEIRIIFFFFCRNGCFVFIIKNLFVEKLSPAAVCLVPRHFLHFLPETFVSLILQYCWRNHICVDFQEKIEFSSLVGLLCCCPSCSPEFCVTFPPKPFSASYTCFLNSKLENSHYKPPQDRCA